MSLGPLMFDLEGPSLSESERERLRNPLTGGVILFTRNFISISQLAELIHDIRNSRDERILVAVDHEGGRVQRFRHEFTQLPACGKIGQLYDTEQDAALKLAYSTGWLMAAELRAVDIDFSFAPVADLDSGVSEVIGDRGFHRDPQVVSRLTVEYIHGMGHAGMAAIAKHFPGHGAVVADSHLALPIDTRSLEEIEARDLKPFEALISAGIAGVMPAHVIFSRVDDKPAGFSRRWLKDELRDRLGFSGAILSDDLSMEAAAFAGGAGERVKAALSAGCDMVLVCNKPGAAEEALQTLTGYENPASDPRLEALFGAGSDLDNRQLALSPEWKEAVEALSVLA